MPRQSTVIGSTGFFGGAMSLDATYSFVYCGEIGLGIGIFDVVGGNITGHDFAGGVYAGTVKEQPDGSIFVHMEMTLPAGGVLVQGTAPQEIDLTRVTEFSMPAQFGDGVPQTVPIGPGMVTVMVKQVEQGFAALAHRGFRLVPNPA